MDQYLINHERILLFISFMRLALIKSNPNCSINSLCKEGDNICVADCDSEDCLGDHCQGFRGCHHECLPGSHSLMLSELSTISNTMPQVDIECNV